MNTKLRIVTLGDFANYFSYFLYGTMEGAIRNGAWFRSVPLFGQDLSAVKSQIDFMKPKILFAHCIFNRHPHNPESVFEMLADVRKKWGTKVFYHMGDARTEPRYPHDISAFVDFGLINNSETDRWSNIWKVPCYHWPYPALYQKTILDSNPDFESDIVFTGDMSGKHHEERLPFIAKLREKVKVKTYPDDKWGNSRFLTAEVSASSKCIVGIQMGKHIPLYQDVRPFQYIGAGALYFHDIHPNIFAFFKPLQHYIPYEPLDADDIFNKLKYYEKHFGEADRIRRNGFWYCQQWHSTERRVKVAIDLADGIEPDKRLLVSELEK